MNNQTVESDQINNGGRGDLNESGDQINIISAATSSSDAIQSPVRKVPFK